MEWIQTVYDARRASLPPLLRRPRTPPIRCDPVTQLHEKGTPERESKIPASHPKGRLLKGDAARIDKFGHLDLSNIKIAAPLALLKPAEPVAVSISLATVLSVQKKIQDYLGVSISLSTFLVRAIYLANNDLSRSPCAAPSADEVFDGILGAEPVRTSPGDYISELNVVKGPREVNSVQPVEEDTIDILSGQATKKSVYWPETMEPAAPTLNVFSLTVPVDKEKRAGLSWTLSWIALGRC
ncbi:hypothetical protein BDW62DRAFT_205789 [Aspergillus aurantiobrunneus]